ncbi:MAG: hypothetical protein H8E46_00870 [FCB group bacterium]|nr:hypothetical protein [FCB group bacterium]
MNTVIPHSIRWGVIGLGRCGSNLAEQFYRRGYPVLAINSSVTDFRAGVLPADRTVNIGSSNRDGAGQDIMLGKKYLERERNRILEIVNDKFKDIDGILLTAGLGGGTGSAVFELSSILGSLSNYPINALLTLPWDGEGSVVKVNAINSLNRLLKTRLGSVAIIDNQRLMSGASSSNLADFYHRGNKKVVSLLDRINRISLNPANKPIIGFDVEDLRRFFTIPGFLTFQEITFSPEIILDPELTVNRIRSHARNESILCSDFKYEQASLVGLVFTAPLKILTKCSSTTLTSVLSYLKDLTSYSGILKGIFTVSENELPRMYLLFAGMNYPHRIDELLKQASSEAKKLNLKSDQGMQQLDVSNFDNIAFFPSQKK